MKLMVFSLFVSLSVLVSVNESAKILAVIPTPSISHQLPFRPLLHELARRGHQVTVITTDPAFPKEKAPNNLTEIDLHDLSYNIWRTGLLKHVKGSKGDHCTVIQTAFDLILDVVDQQMKTKEVQNIINGKDEYDLLILEAWISGLLAFAHRFDAPVIQMSSLGGFYGSYDTYGTPTHPILYPQSSSQRIYNLTFWEKIDELYKFYRIYKMFYDSEEKQETVMRKYFGDDMPSMDELKNKADMLFLNVHPIFEGNFPVPPSVVYVWGIHKKPEKELPQDIKSFLDTSKHGVIYMSFGTNADPANLPPDTIQMFIRVFSQMPYDILWKWSKDELPGKSPNIKIGKWFPQSDLLKHPKIKLFITQGGLQSTEEAIDAKVPLVGLPMLGDQWYNVEKYVHFGIGEKLDIGSLTEDQFRKTINFVINNDSYRKNIEKLGDLLKDDPVPPLERAVWWVEYVLRHGGARHLRAPAANMPWTEYYELQFVLTVLFGLITMFSIVSYSLYVLYAFVTRNVVFKVKVKDS